MTVFKELKDIDHEKILLESNSIIKLVGWRNCQISLQYSNKISWHDDIDEYGRSRIEHECTNFHPDLENTYIKHVLTSLDFPVASARLMLLHPCSCYATHVDYYTRYHIPVISDPLVSYMIFPDHAIIARMSTGKVYWTDTHQLHTFINGAHTSRIHIIFNDANERENFDNPYLKVLQSDRST